jgi:tyrosinase
MTYISRRNFVKGMGALPLALGLPRVAGADDLLVRHDIASPQGRDMLAIFAAAVTRMQTKYAENSQLGWLWQWYTHFVPASTTKAAEIERLFGTTSTTRSRLAEETWDTCQSHSGQDPNNFLPWHRMYVYNLEQIVRRVMSRPDFTMPYWDYTSDDPAKRGVVPVEFRSPGDPVFGSLYRPDRNDLANSGEPIQSGRTGDPMQISGPMRKANYEMVGSDPGFCRVINTSIHSNIHVLVGNRFGMGSVPYAGGDPLFWAHHSNIDRIWASWNLNGGINPSESEWAQQTSVFAGATGRVIGQYKSYFSCSELGYGYDAYIPPPASQTTSTTLMAQKSGATSTPVQPERLAKAPHAAELGASATRVTLVPIVGARNDGPVLGLDPAHPRKRTFLVLKDLHTWAQPGVLYDIYVSPTRGGRLNNASYVGAINFFDAEFHDHGHGAMGDVLGQNLNSFDISELLRRIARSGNPNAREALLVTIVPGGRPAADAKPLVGSIELTRQ